MTQRPTTATAEQIIESIVGRLISQFPEFNESNCFNSDSVEPIQIPRGNAFVTITSGDGVFPEGFFAGGGIYTCTENWELVVTPYVLTRSGTKDSIAEALIHLERGLLSRYKRRIMRSLLVDWQPEYNGIVLLRSQLTPIRATKPRIWGTDNDLYAMMSIYFDAIFDWELSE